MAEQEETIIFRFEVDQQEAIKETVELGKEIDRLTKKQSQLDKSTEEGAIAYAENAASIRALKAEQQSYNKVIDNSIITRTKEIKSINEARANVKLLTNERNRLDITTDEGRAKLAQLNGALDKNNKFIKDNADAYTQQKIGIGQYREGVLAAAGDLKIFGVSLNQLKAGLEKAKAGIDVTKAGFSGFNGVLKASAIGVLITLIGGLIAAFSKFDPLVDKVSQGLAAMGAIMDVFISRLINIGKGLVEIFVKGNLSGGIDMVRESFDGMGKAMGEAATEAARLEGALQDLEDRQTAQIVLNAKAEAQINKLLLQSKNRTLSEKERLSLLAEAGKIELDNFNRNKAIAEDEYKIALEKFSLKSNLSEKEIEELIENTDRRAEIEAKATQLSGDEIKKLAEQKAAIIKLEDSTTAVLEKIANRRDTLIENETKKREEAAKKAAEFNKKQEEEFNKFFENAQKDGEEFTKAYFDEINKRQEAEEKALNDQFAIRETQLVDQYKNEREFQSAMLQLQLDRVNAEIELAKKNKEETTDLELQAAQAKLAIKKNEVEQKKTLNDAEIQSSLAVAQAATDVISNLISAADQGKEAQKAIALTNVAVNLGTAIGNLVASTSAPSPDNLLTGGIAGVVKYATFLAQATASIASARSIIGGAAAGGGTFRTKGPTYMLLGDNPGGVEEISVKPISGKGQTVVNPKSNLMQMGGGGKVYADGGAAVSNMTSSINKAFDVKGFVEAMPAPIVRLTDLNKAQADNAKVVKVSTLG